jgi:hypothetical protein
LRRDTEGTKKRGILGNEEEASDERREKKKAETPA